MVTTGYTDGFNRTVANGLGTADSGQAYTVLGTATQFSVAPSQASIAITQAGDRIGYVDVRTRDFDISGQVAMTAIPATNLATVGFVGKLSSVTNNYNGTMMVATGGAISLRFSKVVGGALSTISTTATGLTYVANTFYNLRFSGRWSQALQTNVLQLKLWAIGATEPGGWMATAFDASHTQYSAGTNVGIHGRDESTVLGTITTRHRSVSTYSYHLPMPDLTDPMCYDPAVAFPQQVTLKSLADAADAAMTTLEPLSDAAALFPRVRVSATNFVINSAAPFIQTVFSATEYNIGTPTNLAQDSSGIYLSAGIWMVTFEIQLNNAASNDFAISFTSTSAGNARLNMRSNAAQSNDDGVGGTGHASYLAVSLDPTTAQRITASISPSSGSVVYTAAYMSLSAIKVSDYFA